MQSVNKAIESSRKAPRKLSPKVEESLENLELFNVTNLGRLKSELTSSQAQDPRKSVHGEMPAANERPMWQQPVQRRDEVDQSISIMSNASHKKPRIKSPFPDEFTKPSPLKSNKPLAHQPDFLDEMLNKDLNKDFHKDSKKLDVSKLSEQPAAEQPRDTPKFVQQQSHPVQSVTDISTMQETLFMPTLPQGQTL